MEREVSRPQENSVKTSAVTLQSLVADYATIPHVIAMDLPFHMRYDNLIWTRSYEVTKQSVLSCKILENWGASAFLAFIWLFFIVGRSIIPHLKEENQSYLLI